MQKERKQALKNVSLIGMPGSGKSTVGVLFAKAMAYDFLDVDLLIQKREKKLLQELVDDLGVEGFLDVEEAALASISVEDCVISPGGSVVCRPSMAEKLKKISTLVYLEVPLHELEARITNLSTRGIAMEKGDSLRDVLYKRAPLYEQYADIKISISHGERPEDIVQRLVQVLD